MEMEMGRREGREGERCHENMRLVVMEGWRDGGKEGGREGRREGFRFQGGILRMDDLIRVG